MKKPYHVRKFYVCDLSEGDFPSCLLEGSWPYSKYMPKPECEKCDLFIEDFMKKHGLKKKKK